jgi:hypothetical protein
MEPEELCISENPWRFAAVSRLLADCASDASAGRARAISIIARALEHRDNGSQANLYEVAAPDQKGMLNAFDALIRETPLVAFGHRVANRQLSARLRDASHLIELGIGDGRQVSELLPLLRGKVHSLRLTGVDLPAPGAFGNARLERLGERLREEAARVGIALSFVPVASRFEALRMRHWLQYGQHICVNAAFALHHLQEAERDELLAQIRDAGVDLFTLVEPDSEHHSAPLLQRIRNCVDHYGAVFDSLDATIASPEVRRDIEHHFFGREITNIVAYDGLSRTERHESRAHWLKRLSRAGFIEVPIHPKETTHLSTGFEVAVFPNGCTLRWKAMPLLTVSNWRAMS